MQKNSHNALVIDDNKMSRSLISYYLKNLGFNVFEAEDGSESLLLMMGNEFDLVVLDWKMPKLNGYETLLLGDEILYRKNPTDKKTPVVIYTHSHLDELIIPYCHNLSVCAKLSKKLTPFQQQRKIETAVNTIAKRKVS